MPVHPRVPISYEYVPTITQFLEGFVYLLLYERGRSAGTGAKIDKCMVGNGRAEDGLERAGNEGGGRYRLEDWGFVFPEKSETCLDESAEGSGKPRIELVFIGKNEIGWRCGTKTGHRFRRDGVEEWAGEGPWRGNGRIGEDD